MLTPTLVAALAFAEDPPVEPGPEAPAPEAEPAKPRKEWTYTALPIANYSTDTGIGYGGFAAVVHNAPEGSEDPWRARLSTQVFFTTKQYQDHNIRLDFPSILGSKYRYDLLMGYERWKQAPYYGVGNFAPRLTKDELLERFGGDEDAAKAYYTYDVSWARLLTNLRRNVGGPWDAFGSVLFRYALITAYDGSLLDEYTTEGDEPLGVDGGLYGRAGVGLMYDTRDQEPSPTKGAWTEGSVRVSALFGAPPTVGVNFTDRRWFSLVDRERLVLANRVIVDVRRGEDPLFASSLLGGSQFVELAGGNNLRGVGNGRYRGDAAVLWTPELRVKYVTAGPIEIFGVPFVDVGRVFTWKDNPAIVDGEAVEDTNLAHVHATAGLGHRFQVGQMMLVRLDIGFGQEEFGTLQDDPKDVEHGLNTSFYFTFDHPY